MMPTKEIEEFAEILITEVRDNSINSCDMLVDPGSNDAAAIRLKNLGDSGTADNYIKALIADCVDDVIFHFLDAIDNGRLQLSYTASNGKTIDLTTDGELSGWYMGSGEWRAKYSKQRFADDFADLTLDE